MNYADQLKHPKWQRRRLERLEAAGWKCKCSATEITLNVHHRRYIVGRAPWEYGDDDLEVLCEDCHAREHGKAPPLRRQSARPRPVMRQPVDRIAWILLLQSGWWQTLAESDQARLCSEPGWHGELFRFLDWQSTEHGAQPWAVLRERLRSERWAANALARVEAEDPAIEPLPEDLQRSLSQLTSAMRVVGRL